MSQDSASNAPEVYLVQAREPGVLAQALRLIEADPSVALQRRMGPLHEPHTLVVSMTKSQADALRERFQGKLLVERDRPLTLFRDVSAPAVAND